MPAVPRHVALNALFLDPGRSAGTETYLRGLVPALARAYPGLRLTLVTTRRGAAALRAEGWTDFAAIVETPSDEGQRLRRLVAEQLRLPAMAKRAGWDILHSLASVAPVAVPVPSVITLHDVTFFHHRTFGLATTVAMRAIVGRAARAADGLITVSAAAREEIVATLGIAPERIAVVHNGAGRPPAPAPREAVEAGRRALELPDGARVVLCVGALRLHKNQALLVRALRELPEDVVLVLAGPEEAYRAEIVSLARRLGVEGRLRLAGYVDDARLEALWGLAGCAAFPTLVEGFGLPVLEALGRGVPVACSDVPVLREVGGEHPEFFDPHDPAAAAGAIAAALAAPRDDPAAHEHAASFTWRAAAHGTYEAYERCMSA